MGVCVALMFLVSAFLSRSLLIFSNVSVTLLVSMDFFCARRAEERNEGVGSRVVGSLSKSRTADYGGDTRRASLTLSGSQYSGGDSTKVATSGVRTEGGEEGARGGSVDKVLEISLSERRRGAAGRLRLYALIR